MGVHRAAESQGSSEASKMQIPVRHDTNLVVLGVPSNPSFPEAHFRGEGPTLWKSDRRSVQNAVGACAHGVEGQEGWVLKRAPGRKEALPVQLGAKPNLEG